MQVKFDTNATPKNSTLILFHAVIISLQSHEMWRVLGRNMVSFISFLVPKNRISASCFLVKLSLVA